MRFSKIGLLIGGILLVSLPAQATATLITFDDLSGGGADIPAGYDGMTWSSSFASVTGNCCGSNGYANGTVSGPNAAFNSFGTAVDFGDVAAFTLTSLYITPAWNNGERVTITGFLNGVQQFQTLEILDSNSANLISLDWAGINDVSFAPCCGTSAGYGGSGEQIVFDNILLDVSTAVPEPVTLSLFGAGLAGAVVMRRRKKKLASEPNSEGLT